MKNIIPIAVILLLLCCSVAGCASYNVVHDGGEGSKAEPDGEEYGEKVSIDGLDFSPLECYDGTPGYFSGNKIINIFRVEDALSLYRVFFESKNLEHALQNFILLISVNGEIQNVRIPYLLPLTKYEIVVSKGGSMGFQVVSAVWDDSGENVVESSAMEFGWLIHLEGTNTIRYAGYPKTIMVFDNDNVCTGIYELGWFGAVVINNGAEYYKVVQK